MMWYIWCLVYLNQELIFNFNAEISVMYKLLPWKKSITTILFIVIGIAVYIDEITAYTGISIPDNLIVRYSPVFLLAILTVIFGPSGRWSPWRWIWRKFPLLNNIFPDINGVWCGYTSSNWPIIKEVLDAAKSDFALRQEHLHLTSLQKDALAIEIKSTLFKIEIASSLTSTDSKSHSLIVCPQRRIYDCVRLTYVYNQDTPNPSITDVDNHLGAANLDFDLHSLNKADGVYWTRRNWKQGLNTAGLLELQRVKLWREKGKSLSDYATDDQYFQK